MNGVLDITLTMKMQSSDVIYMNMQVLLTLLILVV